MSRIGVLGGTFDPVHVGHLDLAEAAARALQLDRVVLMPAHVPPHRARPVASGPHRFAMCALAIAGRGWLSMLDIDMRSNEPAFTSATLDRLAANGMDLRSLFLITGADAFREIPSWMHYPAILDRCHFVVVSRPGVSATSLRALLPELADRMIDPSSRLDAKSAPSIVLVDAPTASVSSTDLRRRLAAGEAIDGLVPDLVAQHIRKHDLYGQS
jgi:nicotinate-nucleotide adenylyltransferase